MRINKIEALIFDWVGVLVSINKDHFISETSKQIDEFIRKNWKNNISENALCKQLSITEDFFPEIMDTFVSECFHKFEPLWNALPDLANRYKLAVINNGPSLTLPSFNRVFKFHEFGIFINSEIEGIRKPDPEIYCRTLKRLNVKNVNALYMDDSPETPEIFNLTGIESFTWKNQVDGFNELKRRLNE